MGTKPIQRTPTQEIIQKQTTESSDLSASSSCTSNDCDSGMSQRTLELNPEYLSHISNLSQGKVDLTEYLRHDLNSVIQTQDFTRKQIIISDSSDSEY